MKTKRGRILLISWKAM